MFSALPMLAHHFNQESYYSPQVSSPLSSSPTRASSLSPSNGDIEPTRQNQFPMFSSPSRRNRKDSTFSKRVTRSNPLIHNRDDGRETRRKLFLKRVREDSEDKRWNARGGEDEVCSTFYDITGGYSGWGLTRDCR
jgi:hypothetical protein